VVAILQNHDGDACDCSLEPCTNHGGVPAMAIFTVFCYVLGLDFCCLPARFSSLVDMAIRL
jgi:hypothetical protein